MTDTYTLFLVIAPIAMFGGGFFIARQLRSLQNVPLISMMFVERKWLASVITGMFISGIFSLTILLEATPSILNVLVFVIMFLIASTFYYLGITLGWGRMSHSVENIALNEQSRTNAFPENLVVDNAINSVKITITTQKRWLWLAMAFFQFIVTGLCALPIFGLMMGAILQNYLPSNLNFAIWILVGGLVLYVIYTSFQEMLEYVFDKEIIEIDNASIKIEKYGAGFKSAKKYSSENIKKVTAMFSFGGTSKAIRRSPFINSNMPAFMMWHKRGLKRYRTFGRAVDLSDAQRILETIYGRFPQYKD